MRRKQVELNNESGKPMQLITEPLGLRYYIPDKEKLAIDVENADDSTYFSIYVQDGLVEVCVGGGFTGVVVYDGEEIVEYESG